MKRGPLDWFLSAGIFVAFVVLLIPAVVLGFVLGRSEKQKTQTVIQTPAQAAKALIEPAPRFTAADLAKPAGDDWPTNGGSSYNQRYSSLDEIDTSNVSQLKGVWLTHLRKSGVGAKYSGESQPVEYQGTIYVPTGKDDVFAVSVDTGEILWQYKANLDQEISVVCCGWESRGVALGDGRVYIGQLDGKLVALDQKTGHVDWSTPVERWQDGYSITAAPLYIDGLVITGISGGEFATRGSVSAYDAATGKLRWRFHTIPGPGETGHDTWPANNDSWKVGGAPVWQTPSVDPDLGLLYFTTGNAGPDNDGSKREGKNLFTASMVALDVHTGKLKWWYQMVHHDIWDYDAPSPTVLFDATVDGKSVKGIGEAEKTGWLYLLNRETGKPLFPTPETSVPQEPRQKTWATQPIPQYAPVVPHAPSQKQYEQVVQLAKSAAKGAKVDAIKAEQLYTPYWDKLTVFTPGPQGGTNWQPSSYNPDTHMFYVCAQSGVTGNVAAPKVAAGGKKNGVAQIALGGTLTIGGGFGQNAGTFTAIDATTGKIVWQKRWPEACYAGSTTTKGNIVFIGRSDGKLHAFNATNGNPLWSFQTGAGANDAPTVFEHNGKEYVAFYAAGNALAASPHGDNLWLFGLDGTMNQVAAPAAGTGVEHAGETENPKKKTGKQTPATAGSAAAGKAVFADNCATCHGALGTGGNGGPDLTTRPRAKNLQQVIAQVTNGGGGMPPFKGTLTDTQIRDVATFVTKNITNK
ncbi:MAG TPA: PQQ-binding-like beta-propeller repeat protein [Gaiellaceae bacterium]|nr:PQQ-binding-like beta-propeller repeat protein [Gaiellaceae bacterium]